MIGASQSSCANSKKLKNTRFASTTSANCCEPTNNAAHIDEYAEYGVINKTIIPEMKILKMEYVQQKSSIKHPTCPPPAPPKPPKCKCVNGAVEPCKSAVAAPAAPLKSAMKVTISEPLEKNSKYLIYKQKNHSIFGSTTVKGANGDNHHLAGKLQYVSGGAQSPANYPHIEQQHTSSSSSIKSAKDANTKKRYLIFDSKKNSNKFDSIQFYFDNKSYEKYVDNKLYGSKQQSNGQLPPQQPARSATPELRHISNDDMKCFENSRSWEYRDHTKTESKLKLFDNSWKLKTATAKSDGGNSSSGASSCCDSEISLKRQNCRLRPELKFSISKSSDDLSSCNKASQDVSRINQLFANATPKQLASKAKFGKFNSSSSSDGSQKFYKKNLTKYHRSTTELSLKPAPAAADSSATSAQSCGFKNCKFSNCPVSSSVASAPISNVNEKRKKFDENFIKKFEDMRKNMKNNEITVNGNHNKSMISVNGKSNIIVNDTKAKQDVFIVDSKHKPNNEQNKTTIKINESCFVVNHSNSSSHNHSADGQNNRNIIELNNSPWNKNIPTNRSNLLAKVENNNRIRNEENSVKIFVSASPTPSTNLSISSSSSSSDSDKDYGYFDTSSQGRSSSPEFVEMFKKFQQLCKEKQNPLMGCDGTMFWNNSYFDDDEVVDVKMTKMKCDVPAKSSSTSSAEQYACTKCHTTTEDLMSNYICICRNKVWSRVMIFRVKLPPLFIHCWSLSRICQHPKNLSLSSL